MKISEILRQADAMPIMNFEGKIQKIYPVEERKGTDGQPFTTQKIVLADDTGVIYAQLSGMDEIPKDAVGQDIFLEAYKSKKFGFTGMKMSRYKKSDGGEGVGLKLSKSVILQIGLPEKLSGITAELPKTLGKSSIIEETKIKGEAQIAMIKKAEDKPDWDNLNMRKDRSMCLAYAKDLAVADKIQTEQIIAWADRFVTYIEFGSERPYSDDFKDRQELESAEVLENLNEGESIPF